MSKRCLHMMEKLSSSEELYVKSLYICRIVLVCSVFFVCFRFSSGLDEKGQKDVPLRTVRLAVVACSQKQKRSLRAGAAKVKQKTETVETFELVKVEPKLKRERRENERGARAGVTFCISSSNLSVKIATF
ncbi:hypothetical protein TNCV_194501 [Trichonephila clavipes]|nr:hypothetical protein TNCV_194501 [Trichonephila clavipes]